MSFFHSKGLLSDVIRSQKSHRRFAASLTFFIIGYGSGAGFAVVHTLATCRQSLLFSELAGFGLVELTTCSRFATAPTGFDLLDLPHGSSASREIYCGAGGRIYL